MRNIKTTMATLGISGAIVLGATLSVLYIRESQDLKLLREELSSATARLETLPKPANTYDLESRKKELESNIAGAAAEIETAKTRLVMTTDSIEVTNTISELGAGAGVSEVSFQSPGWTQEKISGHLFSSLTLTINAQGEVDNLVRFVSDITSRFQTGVVQSSTITVPESGAQGLSEQPNVRIVLSLFGYEGE